eukprot:gene56120-74931_t
MSAMPIPPPCGEGGDPGPDPGVPGRGARYPLRRAWRTPPPDPALRSGPPSPQGGGMGVGGSNRSITSAFGITQTKAHAGGLLVAAVEKHAIVTGGEDGRIIRITADGSRELLADEKGQWIDAIAAGPDGAIAWSTGKTVTFRSGKGAIKRMSAPTTARGLAFLPKGCRLAIAH